MIGLLQSGTGSGSGIRLPIASSGLSEPPAFVPVRVQFPRDSQREAPPRSRWPRRCPWSTPAVMWSATSPRSARRPRASSPACAAGRSVLPPGAPACDAFGAPPATDAADARSPEPPPVDGGGVVLVVDVPDPPPVGSSSCRRRSSSAFRWGSCSSSRRRDLHLRRRHADFRGRHRHRRRRHGHARERHPDARHRHADARQRDPQTWKREDRPRQRPRGRCVARLRARVSTREHSRACPHQRRHERDRRFRPPPAHHRQPPSSAASCGSHASFDRRSVVSPAPHTAAPRPSGGSSARTRAHAQSSSRGRTSTPRKSRSRAPRTSGDRRPRTRSGGCLRARPACRA